ncbi:hypothetical protein [Psychrobacillus glaciei]|uniref:hypothetical protein n=1 Tax=Psychrobacillus glaciei TaxID=2283160 RepID=UPI00124E30A0|nr:hypothetical protein [Psychrobacillus glaciei]
MKWKKTGAALLVTTLTVTSAGYAFANNQLFDTVDLSKLNQQPAKTTVVSTVSEKPVTPSTTNVVKTTNQTNNLQENGLPVIPADYPYDNLKGLYKAYENAQNPKAKEEIKQKIQYLIAKYEASKKYNNNDLTEVVTGLPEIPADYPYDNLKGLYKAYENAQNPKAKENIKLKIEYLIAKYETVKKYQSDDVKEHSKDQEKLKKEMLKEQEEVKKEALKEKKEKEKELRKAQQELHKKLKEKEKELRKEEKNKYKNKQEDNDED